MTHLTDHFTAEELSCKCCGKFILDPALMLKLEWARIHADIPFVISSATRCPEHNNRVGGVESSSHLTGKAVDIRARNFTERYKIIGGLYNAGFKRIKLGNGFVHADVDEDKVQEWFGL